MVDKMNTKNRLKNSFFELLTLKISALKYIIGSVKKIGGDRFSEVFFTKLFGFICKREVQIKNT